jgi:hypothetical protein
MNKFAGPLEWEEFLTREETIRLSRKNLFNGDCRLFGY